MQSLREKILKHLEMYVMDPEIGMDIVNLGLVYKVDIDEGLNVKIDMTLTSMGCPLAPKIIGDIKQTLSDFQETGEIKEVEVNIVWSPPWDKSKMSRMAKIMLGIHE